MPDDPQDPPPELIPPPASSQAPASSPAPASSGPPALIPPLRERHRRFVLEYVIDMNGRAAAIRAGYSRRRAANTASELLRRPNVRLAIREEMKEREKRLRLTAERIIAEAMRIAFVDPARIAHWGPDGVALVDSDDLAPDDRAAVKWVAGGGEGKAAPRFELHDKLAALEFLARLTGLLPRGPGRVRFTLPGADDDRDKPGARRDANAILRERLLKIARSGEGKG